MATQRTVLRDGNKVTIKRYKSGNFGIFRKYRDGESISLIQEQDFDIMLSLEKDSQNHGKGKQ